MKRFLTLLAFLIGFFIAPVAAQQAVRIFGTQSGGTITAALVDSTGRLLVSVAGGAITPTSITVDASTCAAPGLGETGAATTGIAFTATPSILQCVSGTARGTLTASSYTLTVPVLEADGSASAPSYSFASEPNTGLYRVSAGDLRMASAGTDVTRWAGNGLAISAAFYLGWGSSGVSSPDTFFFREAAGHLFQRNGSNAQRASWANAYTSSTNYGAFSIDAQTTANVWLVGSRTAATGTTQEIRIGAQATNGADAYTQQRLNLSAFPFFRQGVYTAAGASGSSSGTGNFAVMAEYTNTATSGSVVGVALTPTYNQSSGTAANTDLLINRTETAVGSGAQYLLEGQRGGTLQFAIRTGRTGAGMQIRTAQQTVPTCSTNCGTSPSVSGTDTAMTVTMGSSGVPASGFVITFNGTWASNPACSVTMAKTGMVVGKMPLTVVTTTTTITVVTNGTNPATTDMYHILCVGIS